METTSAKSYLIIWRDLKEKLIELCYLSISQKMHLKYHATLEELIRYKLLSDQSLTKMK